MAELQARDRLLAAAVDHALDAGIADLSLRELAAAIGTSHRMLLYHFGSREGLLVAVANAVEDRELASALDAGTSEADVRRFFRRVTDPKLWPQERLFFELYTHALLGRPGTEEFLGRVVESWVAPIAARLVDEGADPRRARAEARLHLAVVRGLILDLLASGDRKGVTAAFDRYLELMAAAEDAVAKS